MKDANNTGSIEECLRCGHKWMSKVKYPKRCPNCTSPYWKSQRAVIRSKPAVYNQPIVVEPIVEIPPRLFAKIKNHLFLAMRDKHSEIKFKVKDGVVIDIV